MRLLIDTDTAADDAIALVLAALHPDTEIEGVTVVAGNVTLETGVANARAVLHAAGSDAVVHSGADRPLVAELVTAENVHGPGGLSGVHLPDAVVPLSSEDAVDRLLRASREHPGELTLVTLAPLTNIATALLRDRGFLDRFAHVYCMIGTSDAVGNVTATAEYNAWVDPEALHIVLAAAKADRVTFIGWDVSRRFAVIDDEASAELAEQAGEFGVFVGDVCGAVAAFGRKETGLSGYDLADPIAMAIALDPSIATETDEARVSVALTGEARGQLLIDRRPGQLANIRIVTAADSSKFLSLLRAAGATGRFSYSRSADWRPWA